MSDRRTINSIVIHCADTPNGYPRYGAKDIDDWHKEKGWNRDASWVSRWSKTLNHIGYHAVIEADGTLVSGRHWDEVGSHVRGHNDDTLGICLIGKDQFTLPQWRQLDSIIAIARDALGEPPVIGHRDLDSKKLCPGFNVAEWIRDGQRPFVDQICELRKDT